MKKTLSLALALIMVMAAFAMTVPFAYAEGTETETETETETYVPDSTLYDSKEPGETLYEANFKGTADVWDPNAQTEKDKIGDEHGWLDFTPVVDENGETATFSLTKDNKNHAWGADVLGCPIDGEQTYTVLYTITRTSDQPIALYVTGMYGFVNYATKFRSRRNGSALNAETALSGFEKIPGTTDISVENPSVQEYAIEVDAKNNSIALYIKNTDGNYILLENANNITEKKSEHFAAEHESKYLTLLFYGYWDCADVVVSDVSVRKGLFSEAVAAYNAKNDGDKIFDLNFTEQGYIAGPHGSTKTDPKEASVFLDVNNAGADVTVSADGKSASFLIVNDSNKRAMWEYPLKTWLPFGPGFDYTFIYQAKFGHDNTGFGLQIDGDNGLVLRGDGNVYWVGWNTCRVASSGEDAENWVKCTDIAKNEMQTFAVAMNYNAKTFTLFVKNSEDKWIKVVTYTYEFNSGLKMDLRLYARAMKGTPTAGSGLSAETPTEEYTIDVANIEVYKGGNFIAGEAPVPGGEGEGEGEGEGTGEEPTEEPSGKKDPPPAPILVDDDPTETEEEPKTDDKKEDKKGCGSTVACAGAVLVLSVAGIGAVSFKKKED